MILGAQVMHPEREQEKKQKDDGASSSAPPSGASVTVYDGICHGPVTTV
jgi:hypothetical protein